MLLPFGDFPNPPKAQWVTRILLGLNIAVFLLYSLPLTQAQVDDEYLRDPENRKTALEIIALRYDLSQFEGLELQEAQRQAMATLNRYDVAVMRYGYRPSSPSLLALFTCMFLHAGLLHLAGNMLYLWIFGDNVEARFGSVLYLLHYLLTGVAATMAFAWMNQKSGTPLVGASGAISGVLGAYLIWYPFNQVRVLLFLFVFFTVVHVPAIWVLGAYLVLDNLIPIFAKAESGVAYGAHVGGFAAGALLAFVRNLIKGTVPAPRPRRYVGPRRTLAQPLLTESPREVFRRAVSENRMVDAAHAFQQAIAPPNPPAEPEATYRLGEWLYQNNFPTDASAVWAYYVTHYPRGSDADRAHLGLGILYARRLERPEKAREHLELALRTTRDERTAHTAREELDRMT